MKILGQGSQWIDEAEVAANELVVATTRDELATLAGAINETLEAVDEWEFQTRLGVTPEQAAALRNRINDVLRAAVRPEL